MKKYEYVAIHAKEMAKSEKKIGKIKARNASTQKQIEKKQADLNFEFMYLEQARERIGYALGFLGLDDLRLEYNPTSIQTYAGLRGELENLTFD